MIHLRSQEHTLMGCSLLDLQYPAGYKVGVAEYTVKGGALPDNHFLHTL